MPIFGGPSWSPAPTMVLRNGTINSNLYNLCAAVDKYSEKLEVSID